MRRRTESQFLSGSGTDTALKPRGAEDLQGEREQRPHRSRPSVWTFLASVGALANFSHSFLFKIFNFWSYPTRILTGEKKKITTTHISQSQGKAVTTSDRFEPVCSQTRKQNFSVLQAKLRPRPPSARKAASRTASDHRFALSKFPSPAVNEVVN